MGSITLKDVPKRLHQQLRARAAQNRRSLSQEVVACLGQVLMAEPVDVEALLRKARALRKRVKPINHSDIDKWINQGRP
jgi:plasmid stability protein